MSEKHDRPHRDGDHRRPRRSDDDRGRPARDSRPQRDGSSRSPRDGDSRARRDGDSRPRREGDVRPRRDGDARPRREGDVRPRRDGDSRPRREGDARPRRDGDARPRRDGEGRPRRDGDGRREHAPRAGAGRASDRPTGGIRPRRTDGDDVPRHDDPRIPEDVTGKELDRVARAELKALSKENAERVAQHLVMAARLIDDDPQLAHRHAQAAARRGGRIAVAGETLGITAYLTGDFALALRELRTHRRISGSNEQLPLMVDCERGLGRPEKALELGRSVDRATLSVGTRVELAIALSGARLDLGQTEAALRELEIPQLDPSTAYRFSPALFDSYAVVLAELGRDDEAAEWGRRADVAAEAIAEAEGGLSDDEVEVIEEEYEYLLEDEVSSEGEGAVASDAADDGDADGDGDGDAEPDVDAEPGDAPAGEASVSEADDVR